MSASSVGQRAPRPIKRLNVLRALIKAIILFLALNVAYRVCQPVQTGALPTLYNHLVNGRQRLYWSNQTNLPLLLNDHIIQRATSDTWNVIMLGSSETYGDVEPDDTAISALNALNLQTADGRPVHVYNLAMPIPDVWKDLIIAESVLQSGFPIDMIVLNTFSYPFQTHYPHKLVIHNPGIAAAVVERYQLDPDLLQYLVSPGVQTLWTERAVLSAWLFDQSQAAAWQMVGSDDYANRDQFVEPLMTSLGTNENLPISREEFLEAFRQMAERYHVGLLVVNAPRPLDADDFSAWVQARARIDHVALLDCEFVFAGHPSRFMDVIHLMPETFPPYARILAQHFSHPDMASISTAFPLHLPADFVAPEEECVFLPAV